MFSTALDTMKFLSETRPMIGFSSFFGTGTFLMPYLSYLDTSGNLNVPVFLSLKVFESGLAAPLGRPKVADAALAACDPLGAILSPVTLESPGFEVVFRQKVLEVGAVRGLCFETCFFGFGGT